MKYITIPKVPEHLPVKTSCMIEPEFEYNLQFEFNSFLTIFNLRQKKFLKIELFLQNKPW